MRQVKQIFGRSGRWLELLDLRWWGQQQSLGLVSFVMLVLEAAALILSYACQPGLTK